MTESPFVRTSAVVRCASCQQKYRIKSSHVQRELTTGPRTLDEAETVLRSDSVDIDPDDIAPVSIDDDGNVVGLSGLSELMRQSDAQGAKAKMQERMEDAPAQGSSEGAPPEAVVRLRDGATQPTSSAERRAKLLARRKKKRTTTLALSGVVALLLIIGGLLIVMSQPDQSDPEPNDLANSNGADTPGNGGQAATPPDPNDPADPPTPITDPELFPDVGSPSPNPDPKYVAKQTGPAPDAQPTDVPTVLTPATRIEHEGWYIMFPPRGSAQAAGEVDIQISELTPEVFGVDQTLLTGKVTNRSERVLLSGELHVMLLDSSGRVFAETYLPLIMIGAGGEQEVGLAIASRHWQQKRGVRTSVKADAWGEEMSPMQGVQIDPIGIGPNTAVRLSAKHGGGVAMRGVLIQLEAKDDLGRVIARFVVANEQLYVAADSWLDLVVATPLDEGQQAARWSAVVQPR